MAEEKPRQRAPSLSKTRMRNLKQYKDMPDDQFEELYDQYQMGIVKNVGFERRIEEKMVQFENDYDVSDLKINDLQTLRALIQALIQLEDLEHYMYNIRESGMSIDAVFQLEKLNNWMSSLRSDINKFQDTLGITRKARKNDSEETAISVVEKLKVQAKEFYEQKMAWVFCPKCNMLLATVWWLYPEEKGNRLQLVCNRKRDDGEICGEKLVISSKELLELKGTNGKNIPETLR